MTTTILIKIIKNKYFANVYIEKCTVHTKLETLRYLTY